MSLDTIRSVLTQRRTTDRPAGVFTRVDVQAATGLCRDQACRIIRRGIEDGAVQYAGDFPEINAVGRTSRTPSYRFVKKP